MAKGECKSHFVCAKISHPVSVFIKAVENTKEQEQKESFVHNE